MEPVRTFLEANSKALVDFIESNQRPIRFDNIYSTLLAELTRQIPLEKKGTLVLDKAHIELAIGILEVLWCGWLSQAKANKGAIPEDYPARFKEAIIDAFEVGQKYAAERP